jgi:SAM-dependent methyltransferase
LSLSPPVDKIGEKSGTTRRLHWSHHGLLRERPLVNRPQGRVLELATEADLAGVEEGSLDTVVSVFALCRIGDVGATLDLVRRAMAPGGVLLFLEHAGATGRRQRLQHVATPLWQRLAPGCHLDRDVPAAIRAAGLAITDIERFPLPWARPLMVKGVRGAARRRARMGP